MPPHPNSTSGRAKPGKIMSHAPQLHQDLCLKRAMRAQLRPRLPRIINRAKWKYVDHVTEVLQDKDRKESKLIHVATRPLPKH